MSDLNLNRPPTPFPKPLKKEKPKAKGIAKRSKKRVVQEREYTALSKQFKLDNPICAARLEGCAKVTQDVHHKGGKIGELLCDVALFLPVCRNCHQIIESSPDFAKDNGFSVSRLQKIAA